MAIIQTSGLISSIRGKVAGAVFQLSRSGNILRSLTIPVNRRTLSQNKTRTNTFNILQKWTGLTADQRAIWNAYIQYNPILQKNGLKLHITGQQVFIKFNSYRLEYDLPILETPIFNKCDLTPISLTLSPTIPGIDIISDRPLVSSDEYIILFLTVRFRNSVNNPGSRYRIIKFTTTDTDVFDVTSAYVSVFGRIPLPGDTLFIKYTNASKLSGLPFPFKTEKVLL
jgi:hypothetical protein